VEHALARLVEAALVAGLASSGVDVRCIGLGPTPMLYFAVHHLGADGGIQAQTTIPAANLCLRMTGNTTANNFILDNRSTANPASFRIEGASQVAFEAANTATGGNFNYLLNPAAVSFVPVGTCGFVP